MQSTQTIDVGKNATRTRSAHKTHPPSTVTRIHHNGNTAGLCTLLPKRHNPSFAEQNVLLVTPTHGVTAYQTSLSRNPHLLTGRIGTGPTRQRSADRFAALIWIRRMPSARSRIRRDQETPAAAVKSASSCIIHQNRGPDTGCPQGWFNTLGHLSGSQRPVGGEVFHSIVVWLTLS